MSKKQDGAKKEYQELLIKYYTDNNSFIEKAIFTVSAGATTFLLGYSDKICKDFEYYVKKEGNYE